MIWTKIFNTIDYDFVQASQEQINIYNRIIKSPCSKCSLLKQHLGNYIQKCDLLYEKDDIETQMHDESLAFKPLLDMHVKVLQDLEYITNDNVLLLKGRVSIEISSCHEILGTELLFSGIFDDMTPIEIAASCAALVSEGIKSYDFGDIIPPTIEEQLTQMNEIASQLFAKFISAGIPVEDEWVDNNVNFSLIQVVYDWAVGLQFSHIMDITDIPEGTVVRIINRLSEVLKDFSNASKLMGCKLLSEKFDQAGELIKRDIIFASSLYFD